MPDTSAVSLKAYGDTLFQAVNHGPVKTTFAAAHLDLFLTAEVGKLSFLSEVFFEAREDNSIGTDIERLQVTYLFENWFRVHAGRSHTAFGYYSDTYHHGNLFELTTARPFGVGFEDSGGLFTAHLVGAGADGTFELGKAGALRYDAEVGNGRLPHFGPAGIASLIGQEASSFSVSRDQFLEVLRATVAGQSPSITAAKLADWVLTPVDISFRRLGEHAGELATRLGKKVEVLVDAGGLRLDNERWGPFWAAYVHAVRNAVDHGLELPDERVAAGKLPAGTVSLSAEVEQDFFAIELRDDGRGIAWSAISERLRERGLPATTAEQLTDGLFLDGLSTARDVTDVSGRGIGMGALRAAVAARGGRIEVRSTLGVGMTLRCVFPACATMEPSWVLKREIARQAAGAPDSSATVPPVRRLRAA